MSIWRSAFLHEFPSANPRNYLAPPGSLSFVEFTLSPNVETDGFLINPSRWLRYDFQDRFDRVLGVDITIQGVATIPVSLIFPPVPSPYFQIASIGNGAIRLAIAVEGEPDKARVRLVLGGQEIRFEGLDIPDSFGQVPFKLQARWHTTGQVNVWWNDQLVAYEPSHAVGATFSIGDVALGTPHQPPGVFLPSMDVTSFYVKVLREEDPEIKIGPELELDLGYLDPADPCWERIRKNQGALIESYRAFMGKVVSKLTKSWRNSAGGQPFSLESLAAHKAAVTAFAAFLEFVRTGDAAHRDAYLADIQKFLDVISSAEPEAYQQLLSSIKSHDAGISEECRAKAQALFETNLERLEPLKKLMDETMTIATHVAGGQ